MYNVLFVCTGNTCRSSMAEGIFRNTLNEEESLKELFTASSAGLAAYDGEPASRYSIETLKSLWGLDISSHRSRRITESDIGEAYLILTMTRSHKDAIIAAFPQFRHKVYTLKEYVSDKQSLDASNEYNFALDIMDPYGMSVQVYKKTAEDIKNAVSKLVEKLKKANKDTLT